MKKQTKSKKGFVSVHAGMWFIAGLVIGAGAIIYLARQGLLPSAIIGGA